MKDRPKQTNCQNEPDYPDHETVLFSIVSPDHYLDTSKNVVEIKEWPKNQK